MPKKFDKGITSKDSDYSKWYNDIVNKADLAEISDVRGCMVIKPYGFAIWEKMKAKLDEMFKKTGHQNAYFPLFVPKRLFEAEEKNAEGFAKECAVVTHYRLKNDPNEKGKLIVDSEAKLEEELVVRPTSEAVIWSTFKKWIQSYRDLPILINQWANVVRWEMRTRLFLRTSEFLWQEGHTAHEQKKEALDEALLINDIYKNFCEDFLAIPVVQGLKSESEKFAGAEETYCIESLMQDGKALQMGTSHFLGQNFAKAFDVKYAKKDGGLDYVWATSWGVSTRLMGALIMSHSDDKGLVLPPSIAPIQVVIVPIYKNTDDLKKIKSFVLNILEDLDSKNITVKFDDNDKLKPGFKFNEYELKGIPIRLAVGLRDIKNSEVELARRDNNSKTIVKIKNLTTVIQNTLDDIQKQIFVKAKLNLKNNITVVSDFNEFKNVIDSKGGFVYAYWDGTNETEEKIKKETKATIRCIPYENKFGPGKCIYSGKDSHQMVLFAKSY